MHLFTFCVFFLFLQAFAHIPVTGRIDEETKHLMKKPRCGLPDIISDSYRAK